MKLASNYARLIRNWILDVILPEKCLSCQTIGEVICANCVLKIRRAERETENDIYACFDYRDPVIKKAIWNLKYYNRKGLGEKLGNLLYDTLIEEIADMKTWKGDKPIYVIPVPLSPLRYKIRGYNQAEIIARNFCISNQEKDLELKKDVVLRTKDKAPQAKITNRTQRLANICGVFEIKNKDLVGDQTFIIIDDVTTTGGTINEVIKILKKHGAKKVIGFTIAH